MAQERVFVNIKEENKILIDAYVDVRISQKKCEQTILLSKFWTL